MDIKIYNTLTRTKETFEPIDPNRVRMFVCGPTVYDVSHIGHAKTYIQFDMIARVLRRAGLPLEYVVNITDIEDKIIARANEKGRDFSALAKEFEEAYYEDMEQLGIASVSRYPRASDFVPEIIEQIQELEKKGYAYKTSSGVYFRVKNFKDYGKLSNQKMDEIKSGVRIPKDEEKEDPTDFVLWKAAKPNEPSWDSPWGKGRPGWHIEDTAITYSIFGAQYDLHGGALDLIFPHHESEIAQNEAAYDVDPFVKIWMHTGFLNIRGEKMSKSLGNFTTIRDMLQNVAPEVFRFFVLSAHYRSPIDFDNQLLTAAEASLERIVGFRDRLDEAALGEGADIKDRLKSAQEAIDAAFVDDFDTPAVLATLFELIRDMNPHIESGSLNEQERDRLSGFLRDIDGVLGILPEKRFAAPEKLIALAEKREQLRTEKKFDEADKARDEISAAGWEIEDTPKGPRLVRRGQ